MRSVIALVGRPNVGKSTLFNRLTRRRDALVADAPGLTRDRRYGVAQLGDRPCTLIDTGGLFDATAVGGLMAQQAAVAIDEADVVLFVVDARAGLTPSDIDIADQLRKRNRKVVLAANKIDGAASVIADAEFSRLGFAAQVQISAAHGRGMGALQEALLDALPSATVDPPPAEDGAPRMRVAVIGRPNVGKSTLVNRWLGQERQVVFDAPGTTRDAIEIPFEHDVGRFTLIDTAGVRRKGKVDDTVEKFSVVKALEAIDSADVAVVVIDASEQLVEQDLHLLGYAIERGAGLVLAVNKWDGLTSDQRDRVKSELDRRLEFAPWAPVHRISALHGTGVRGLLEDVKRVYEAGRFEVSTAFLARVLTEAVEQHAPPSSRGRRIKLRFAHKASGHPPTIVVHGNQTHAVPESYTRYLENRFREALNLVGMPVRIVYKTGVNPFAGRRNELTPRQQASRKRLMRHVKK
jgi:GTP-binding protein